MFTELRKKARTCQRMETKTKRRRKSESDSLVGRGETRSQERGGKLERNGQFRGRETDTQETDSSGSGGRN